MVPLLLFGLFFIKNNNIKGELPMNNNEIMEKLTLGKEQTETVEIDGIEIELRPLTSGELAKLQTIEKQGFIMKVGVNSSGKRQNLSTNDVDINAGEFNKAQTEAMFKAVAWSMGISEDKVENFTVGMPEKIFEQVIRISNLDDEALTSIKQFRKKE